VDLIINNIRVVRPGIAQPESLDIAIQDGKIVAVGPNLPTAGAKAVYDGGGKLAFPGLVDAHMHTGIYAPLHEDALTESRAAAMGGVTSSLNYIRTGQYYLNRGGAYVDFMPVVYSLSAGNFYVDYAYHIAPLMRGHLDEIETLIEQHGVLSFKIFMFYGAHGLHGKAANQSEFLMTPPGEHYDIAHFEFVMRAIRRAAARFPELKDEISLSLHCETAEIMRAYTEMVEQDSSLQGHQSAAPDLAQSRGSRPDDAGHLSTHSLPARSDHRPSAVGCGRPRSLAR
jgi:allantoinase